MQSRKRLFLGVVALAVLFGAGGYFLGRQLESPEDARAEVAAPEPSLISIPVEAKLLSNDVVVRGTAEFEGAIELELDASLGDGTSRVVTGRVPEVDSLVNEGDVLIEVSGRPVFALAGALPAFREFKPGLEGDDVLQLEEALARLGYLDVPPDRLYGSATEQAITAMYDDQGYEPRAESDGEETQLDGARDAVDAARESLANANDSLADLSKPPSQVERLSDAEAREARLEAIDDAVEALSDAEEARDEAERDTPSDALLAAIDAVQDAENTGDPDAVAGANRALAQAQQGDLDRIEAAKEGVEDAKEALAETREALADYDALQAAEDADIDTADAQKRVGDAAEDLAKLEADLAELEEDIGVRLPAAEIVFLEELPRTITAVDVERGDPVMGSVMRISGTDVRIPSAVSEANRSLVEVGQIVIIDDLQLGIELEGEVTEIADRTGTNDAADTRYYMEVVPTLGDEYTVTDLVGISFRLRIPVEKSEGEVLAVPLAALSIGADETARVEVLEDDGSTRIVEVEVGLQDKNSSDVEVTPLNDDLVVGDRVVTGTGLSAVPAAADGDEEGDGS